MTSYIIASNDLNITDLIAKELNDLDINWSLKALNRIKYSDIVNILNANNINVNLLIFKDDLVFDKISSLADANENDITFFKYKIY